MFNDNLEVIFKSKFYPSSIINFFFLTEITINYKHGLPLITLTLPSRKERCQFVVKPMLSTVGSFLQDLQNEDKGIRTAAVFTAGIYIHIFPTFFLFFWNFVLFLYFLENYYIINGWSLLSPSFLNMNNIKRMNSNGEERNGISLIHALVIYFIKLSPQIFLWENFNDVVISI